jgi:hypothetical protein
MPAPEWEADAKKICQPINFLTAEHTKKYGPQISKPSGCTQEGKKCAEYPSNDGKTHLAIYCDGQNGCTRYYECPND